MPTISFDVPAIRTSAFETMDGGEKWGTLIPIDLKAKGKILRQQKKEYPQADFPPGNNYRSP